MLRIRVRKFVRFWHRASDWPDFYAAMKGRFRLQWVDWRGDPQPMLDLWCWPERGKSAMPPLFWGLTLRWGEIRLFDTWWPQGDGRMRLSDEAEAKLITGGRNVRPDTCPRGDVSA